VSFFAAGSAADRCLKSSSLKVPACRIATRNIRTQKFSIDDELHIGRVSFRVTCPLDWHAPLNVPLRRIIIITIMMQSPAGVSMG
jgi:hypothetical protein